eukprot:60736_1
MSSPLEWTHNAKSDAFETFMHIETAISPKDISVNDPPIILTASVQRTLALIRPWLKAREPFIVAGPEGCGKTLVLRHAFRQLASTNITTVHCSAQTSAAHVVQKLEETCAIFQSNQGKVYRPKGCDRLILFLKDINLPKPDKYNTMQLIAFLQQLISYQGFYDDQLEFIHVERVQIVASMNPSSSVGRYPLSTRFTAIVRIASMTYPPDAELFKVFAAFLEAVIQSKGDINDSRFRSASSLNELAQAMVEVYSFMCTKFSVDDQRHYLFTPRDITAWAFGLTRYDLSSIEFLDAWTYEAYRIFSDRLVDEISKKKFSKHLLGILRSRWDFSPNLDGMYFTALGGTHHEFEETESG